MRKISDYIWAIRLAAKLEWKMRGFSAEAKHACRDEFFRRAQGMLDKAVADAKATEDSPS